MITLTPRALQFERQNTPISLTRRSRYLYHYRKEDGKALTIGTQKAWLSCVTAFFSWLTREGLALYNPASDLELPRREVRLPKIILNAGVGKSGSCRLFRHTFATLLLENGCDVRYVQEMLGHSKMETTAVYTHVAIKTLKEVHSRFHPARLPQAAQD
jgi:site-specific recombinase XerD